METIIKTVKFTGIEVQEQNVPFGEEKRVAAGLAALDRCPDNYRAWIFDPSIIQGPITMADYDILVPLAFLSPGGWSSNRRVALVGDVPLHITKSKAVTETPLYTEDEEWVTPPTLLVTGADGAWHAYRGPEVTLAAQKFLRCEMQRRILLEQEVYDGFSPIGMGDLLNALESIEEEDRSAWYRRAEALLRREEATTE